MIIGEVIYTFLILISLAQLVNTSSIFWPPHKLEEQLLAEIRLCHNHSYCDENLYKISQMGSRLVNDFSAMMLAHRAQSLLRHYFALLSGSSPPLLRLKVEHMLSVLAFSQGDLAEAERHWPALADFNLVSKRTLAAQVLIGGSEKLAVAHIVNYTAALGAAFAEVLHANGLLSANCTQDASQDANTNMNLPATCRVQVVRSASTEDSEDALLAFMLSEAQGGVRVNSKLSDLELAVHEIRPFDARQRFRLGVGLAKLGLFDLSLRHVSLSATPWEGPLFRLRARLVFSPVHGSVRLLAQAVDRFVRQGEGILGQPIPVSSLLTQVCDSPNEAALALQALPLLHLAGFAAPRARLLLGHSPVALPILLSEVFEHMCPVKPAPASLFHLLRSWNGTAAADKKPTHKRKQTQSTSSARPVTIGVVSGSMDGIPGRIVIGLMEEIRRAKLPVQLVAMCFPTPRDRLTDRATGVFDAHINLSPHNKSQGMQRILEAEADIIIFVDAALDSRVFTLAHERLAFVQAALWAWGGTLGIPTIDHYFVPEVLVSRARCPMPMRFEDALGRPQQFFSEQVVLLEGMPAVLVDEPVEYDQLAKQMTDMYLLPSLNSTHIYVFPGSVKHLHPEFDPVLLTILQTDPMALILLAVARTGRDRLPPTHIAVRHDLMHPTMPGAAAAKLRSRLTASVGENFVDRIRVLPPMEEGLYAALLKASVAVLDPFPVGLHVQVLEALMLQVPVVSAPELQECTNSHADSLAHFLRVGPHNQHITQACKETLGRRGVSSDFEDASSGYSWTWPSTAEEYAVVALRLQSDKCLRETYRLPEEAQATSTKSGRSAGQARVLNEDEDNNDGGWGLLPDTASGLTHGAQLLDFVQTLLKPFYL